MSVNDTLPLLALQEVEGEPTVLDTDLGKALGMTRPTNIRATIEAHRVSLEQFGILRSARAMVGIGSEAKREVTQFHLNEEQALYVTMHCRTKRAEAVKVRMVKVFSAWRHGTLQPFAEGKLSNDFDPIAAVEAWIEQEALKILPRGNI